MKLDTQKACNLLGTVFFVGITLIEIVMFCNVFNAFEGNGIRLGAIAITVISFNVALWFFALTYYKTLLNTKK